MAKKPDTSRQKMTELLASLADEDYCYLTTIGRVTGNPHEIEIWFGIRGETLYLLSGGGQSDWVKNLRANPGVTVRIAKHMFRGTAHEVREEEELAARHMLAAKYEDWKEGELLSEWARTALVVGIELAPPRPSPNTTEKI